MFLEAIVSCMNMKQMIALCWSVCCSCRYDEYNELIVENYLSMLEYTGSLNAVRILQGSEFVFDVYSFFVHNLEIYE